MITFSFRPSSRSTLPSIDASVSTFVVSWKDAAERNDSVASDAFVIPRISGSNVACSPFAFLTRAFSRSSTTLSTSWPGRRSVVAGVLDAHLLQHLPDDQLDVLVVDVDALRLVDLLHLADEVQLVVACSPSGASSSAGLIEPSCSASPASTIWPFVTSRRVRRGSWNSFGSASLLRVVRGWIVIFGATVRLLDRRPCRRPPRASRRPSGSAPRRSRRRAAGRA